VKSLFKSFSTNFPCSTRDQEITASHHCTAHRAFGAYQMARVLHGWGQRSLRRGLCGACGRLEKTAWCVCVETNKTHVCDVGKRKTGLNFALCALLGQSINTKHVCVLYCKKRLGQLEYYATRADNNWEMAPAGKTLVHITRSLERAFKSATYWTRIISKARHTLFRVTIDPLRDSVCDSTHFTGNNEAAWVI
jgi:hypothetical protein